MRIGIDVGGTFTDVVLIDDATGRIEYTKIPTTPKSLSEGVIAGIDKILAMAGATMDDVDYVVHGTTIGTNALIERRGAKTGLLTTAGFRDVLDIGRVQRPAAGLYDFMVDNPQPLVPRQRRLGIRERIDAQGQVILPLDEADAARVIDQLKAFAVESVAVCFLFSFLHPEHERRVGEMIAERMPDVFVTLSCDVAPEFREFERTSTTVINAFLTPVTKKYVESLQAGLAERFGEVDLRIMQASGGSMTAAAAKNRAVNMVNSGPAGGAVAGCFIGGLIGEKNLVTVDMGGTSFDISLVSGGAPTVGRDSTFQGFPVKIPAIDINAIGAGGGSIAWVDRGGALNVGPISAGSEPGPACYGHGGTRPTVTDANLVLGRLNPDYFLGGEITLDLQAARDAIQKEVAEPMKLALEEAAWGILRLVNANMVKGISVSSTERGFDVREYVLVAFGGAGSLHAAELAWDIGISKIVVPRFAGNLSAFGLLVSDTRHEFVQTVMRTESNVDTAELSSVLKRLNTQATDQLRAEGVGPDAAETVWSVDLRYQGQSYELNVLLDHKGALTDVDIERLIARFNEQHEQIYAYSSVDEEVEFVNLRVIGIGHSPKVSLAALEGGDAAAALKARRTVFFGEDPVDCPVYERDRLPAGVRLEGPCLIEETISTTVVPHGMTATLEKYGNIIIEVG